MSYFNSSTQLNWLRLFVLYSVGMGGTLVQILPGTVFCCAQWRSASKVLDSASSGPNPISGESPVIRDQ